MNVLVVWHVYDYDCIGIGRGHDPAARGERRPPAAEGEKPDTLQHRQAALHAQREMEGDGRLFTRECSREFNKWKRV